MTGKSKNLNAEMIDNGTDYMNDTATYLPSIDIYGLSNQKDKRQEENNCLNETMIVHPENIQETTPLENQHHKDQLPPYTEQDQAMFLSDDTNNLLENNENDLSEKGNHRLYGNNCHRTCKKK